MADALTGAECDDGNACTTEDTCVGTECILRGNTVCDDEEQCTDDSCDSDGGCVFVDKVAGTPCNDGDACTLGDACGGDGKCKSGQGT